MFSAKLKHNFSTRLLALLLTIAIILIQSPIFISAAALTSASVSLGDSRPSQTSIAYTFQASGVTGSVVRCVQMQFATTVDGTTAPTGFSSTSATVNASSNYATGINTWTVEAATAGRVRITDATGGTPSASNRTVILNGITNGSTAETTYFLQFDTFGNIDCSTTPIDDVVVAFVYVTGQAVSLSVDSTLTFALDAVAGSQAGCNGGPNTTVSTTDGTIPFGTISVSANGSARHNTSVSTNASGGYSTYIRYTGLPTNGSHNFTAHTGTNGTPTAFPAAGATEAFGYTTDGVSFGSNTWAGFTTANEVIATSGVAVNADATCVGYQVSITGVTPAGLYQGSTVIITATPQF